MAKKIKTLQPPSPEAREQLLAVIRSTAEPLPAKALSKLLVDPHRIAESDLLPVLDELVLAGVLFAYPGKTAAGKPRYWDRDAYGLGRTAVLEALEQAEKPLTIRELLRHVSGPLKFAESEIVQFVEEFTASGRIHRFQPPTAKGKPAYWNRDALEYGRMVLRKTLDAKGPQTDASLKKALKGLPPSQFEEIVEGALAAREVWRHPTLAKTGKSLLGLAPPSPEPYLRDVGRQLSETIARLTAVHVSREAIRRALVQLIEQAGIPFASRTPANQETTKIPGSSAVDLIGLMRRIEPGADRGALVGARDLRRAAGQEKGDFDRALLELARQGKLSLHRHDFAASLSPAERDELVTDGEGTYYVGVALRQNGGTGAGRMSS